MRMLALFATLTVVSSAWGSIARGAVPAAAVAGVAGFIPNRGQVPGPARFYATGGGAAVFFEPGAVTLDRAPRDAAGEGVVLRVEFPSAARPAVPRASRPLEGRVHRFGGPSGSRVPLDLPTYGEVRYARVAPGDDIVYRLCGDRLEYDVVVAPGADLAPLCLRYRGADRLEITADGRLRVWMGSNTLEEEAPALYQERDGVRRPVGGGYRLMGGDRFGFWAADYDRRLPLVVDPGILWSSFLGGSATDCAYAVANAPGGDLVVAGYSQSSDYPTTPGVYQASKDADTDVCVTRLRADGQLRWSTYVGGGRWDAARAVAVDVSGNVYLTGETLSDDFPVTPGAFSTHTGMSGTHDAFVTKLSADGGSLLYSSYLGGLSDDYGTAIAVNGSGEATIAGDTGSNDFPTTSGVVKRTRSPGLFDGSDGFVVRMNATGGALIYATYVGSNSNSDLIKGLALDAAGEATLTGWTASSDFPTTSGAWDRSFGGSKDAFVSRLNATATAYVYSTFVGGAGVDEGHAVAVDASGGAVIVGATTSTDFPTTAGALQRTLSGTGTYDAFVVRVSATGGLVLGSYLGGSGSDAAYGVAVAPGGELCVTGATNSTNIPTSSDAFSTHNNGGAADGFVSALNAGGTGLVYSSYLGSAGNDQPQGICVTPDGRVAVAGYTDGAGFPTTAAAFDVTYGGAASDGFLTIMDMGLSGTAGVGMPPQPALRLADPAPNPFTAGTRISLSAPEPVRVRIRVLDVQGREVLLLADEWAGPVERTWLWDGRDRRGGAVAPGVYLVDVRAGEWHSIRRVTRIR